MNTRMWREIERPWDDRILGGVCAGLSERFGIDATLLRLAFLLLVLAKGLGLILYGLLWLVLPAAGTRGQSLRDITSANVSRFGEEMRGARKRFRDAWDDTGRDAWPRPIGRRWLAIGLIALGAFALLWSFGLFSWITGPRVLGLVLIAAGIGALITLTGGDRRRRR